MWGVELGLRIEGLSQRSGRGTDGALDGDDAAVRPPRQPVPPAHLPAFRCLEIVCIGVERVEGLGVRV